MTAAATAKIKLFLIVSTPLRDTSSPSPTTLGVDRLAWRPWARLFKAVLRTSSLRCCDAGPADSIPQQNVFPHPLKLLLGRDGLAPFNSALNRRCSVCSGEGR